LGRLREGQHDLFAALDYYKRSLAFAEQAGDEAGQLANLTQLGAVHQARNRPAEAERCYRAALDLARRGGRPELIAANLRHLGEAAYNRGDYAAAFEALWQAHTVDPRDYPMKWMYPLFLSAGPEVFIAQARRLSVDPALLDQVAQYEPPGDPSGPPTLAQLVALRLRVGPQQFAVLAQQSQIPADIVAKVESAAQSLA
jgi:tetratricopeptide (TPR) repeat protein